METDQPRARLTDVVPNVTDHVSRCLDTPLDEVPAWQHLPTLTFECALHPGETFQASPTSLSRRPDRHRCRKCLSFAARYPNLAACAAPGWDPWVTDRSAAYTPGHPFVCPNCTTTIDQVDPANLWHGGQRFDDPAQLVDACRSCTPRTLADIPTLAAHLVRTGLDGQTDPAKVVIYNGPGMRAPGTVWRCATCGKEHERSLYSTKANALKYGIDAPYCRTHSPTRKAGNK